MSVAALAAAYREPEAYARARKDAGERIIAHLCDNVPTELIAAAGAFPLRVHGRPSRHSGASARLIDPLYPPDVTQRPDFVGSMIDTLLDGRYDFADAVVVPHNRNAIQAIHRELGDARAERGISTPPTWYLDKAWSPFEEAARYNRAAIIGLRDRLGAFVGRPIDDAALAAAIADANRARDAVAAIIACRLDGLAGSVALQLIGAFWSLPARDYAALVDAALAEPSPRQSGPRLYLGGSPVDEPELYAIVESLGANIVTEDHCWGARAADGRLPTDIAPIEAIAQRFHSFPACSIRFPFERVITANLDRAQAARVDGAIFYVAARDTTQGWETPEQLKAFAAAGIPTLHLRSQPYDVAQAPELRSRIDAFIATVRS